MGTPQIDDATWQRGLVVARALKTQLEARVVGKKAAAWRCGCGACGAGESTVKAVSFPTSYRNQLGMHILWSVNLEDAHGKRWSTGITQYIRWMELYPLFRNAFKGVDVCTDHPHADVFHDVGGGDGRAFVPSSRTVVVRPGNPVRLRPAGDLESSVWESAMLRVDTNLERFGNGDKPLLTCLVDPHAFGQRSGPEDGNYFNVPDLSKVPTFHMRIADEGHVPLARLVAHDLATNALTFVLDESVEEQLQVARLVAEDSVTGEMTFVVDD